jgi:hypothetical protein
MTAASRALVAAMKNIFFLFQPDAGQNTRFWLDSNNPDK